MRKASKLSAVFCACLLLVGITSCKTTAKVSGEGKTIIITSATDTTVINHNGVMQFPKSK